jgi:hypothetical protein
MVGALERLHTRPVLLVFVLTCCLLPVADLAIAGQQQSASIIGQVTDESGAVLPGVTVTATSPALQVPQVVDVSNTSGEYRLTPLPIGIYTVQYELSGFQGLRQENVRLTAGFTAKVDVKLKVGALAETITVSGAAPVVDVTSTTTVTQLTSETLEIIPTSREGIRAVMAMAPGVRTNLDFGGAGNTSPNATFRVFGQSNEAWVVIDGVPTSSPKSAGNGTGQNFDFGALEESTVSSVGNDAQSVTKGIQLSVILKSGGNDFHGGFLWDQSNQSLQSDNVDDKLRAQGIKTGDRVEKRWDLSGELGGRIVRNKLWFYYAGHARTDTVFVANAFKPDGSKMDSPTLQWYSTEKVSYQMSSSQKLIGFHQRSWRRYNEPLSQNLDWGARTVTIWPVDTQKLEYQAVKGNKILSLDYGLWHHFLNRFGCCSTDVATLDQLTLKVAGLNNFGETRTHEKRQGPRGTFGWYKQGQSWGSHDVKTGFDALSSGADRQTFDRGAAQNYILIFRGGSPFQFQAKNNPVDPQTKLHYLGVYGQDNWTIARRLTLSLGARYEHNSGALPAQCRETAPAPLASVWPAECFAAIPFKTFNQVVPRLHAAYDVTGNGRTVIKGGWGRYAHMRYADEVQMANLNLDLTAIYQWHDLNGNLKYDPGEVNLDKNGPDFVAITRLGSADALSGAVINPNEKQVMSDEYSLSGERQLMADLGVRATWVYSKDKNTYRVQNNLRPYSVYTIPITNTDPGPDGIRGTADDPGKSVTYYDYPAAYRGNAFQQPMLINDPKANASYNSVELAATKRLSNRWLLNASYSSTKLHIPYVANTAASLGVSLSNFDPNSEINSVNNAREWLTRLGGAYILPADVQVSANFEQRSGEPFARTVSFTGGTQIPSILLKVEPIGAHRLPTLNILSLRFEKAFHLANGRKMALRLNVYNALNINTPLTVQQQSGAAFLRPLSIAPPRIAEFGATYTF